MYRLYQASWIQAGLKVFPAKTTPNTKRSLSQSHRPVLGDSRRDSFRGLRNASPITATRGSEPPCPVSFNYDFFCEVELAKKKKDGSYRIFNNINRLASSFPMAKNGNNQDITVWCANDYLGMSRNAHVLNEIHSTLDYHGVGAGGTRNISGNNMQVELLESKVAELHKKDAALVFSSCYVANDAVLATLGSKLPGCVFLSDELNHASMIEGIRHSRAEKLIFKHNDMQDLETKLQSLPHDRPKIIAFESVYSMSGSIGRVKEICELAKRHGAITFLDEVHAVGMYGPTGSGVAEHLDWDKHVAGEHKGTVLDQVDIISGTFGKAYGVVGGYVAASSLVIDYIRSFAPGFIFTTSLPPAILAGARASINLQQRSLKYRRLQQINTRAVKDSLSLIDIPILENPSHIIPILVGNSEDAKKASDMLLDEFGIYIQSINFPTVPVGQERLRVTPTPGHTQKHIDELVMALDYVWDVLHLKRKSDWLSSEIAAPEMLSALKSSKSSLWTDKQLGLKDEAKDQMYVDTQPLGHDAILGGAELVSTSQIPPQH